MASHTGLQTLVNPGRTTFKEIQYELRFQMVIKLMNPNDLNLEEVAYLVGYSDATALVRAFMKWKGISPKQFIKSQNIEKI